jgi:O-antigen ligase
MMPQHWLLGNGPDTFVNIFPHHDRLQVVSAGIPVSIIVDKPHNLYLNTWITKGGIAALALIFLFAHYLITTFILLLRAKKETAIAYGLRLGLLAGMTAFMVASLATDSTIGSTGVFFVLLGMGYGLNRCVKQHQPLAAPPATPST